MAESLNINIGATIRTLLLQSSDVTAVVGTRIYSDHLPQSVQLPAVIYNVISEVPNDVLDGPLGFEDVRIQLDAYALTRDESVKLWQRMRKQMLDNSYAIVDGVQLREISQASGHQYLTDRSETGSDQRYYRTTQDFSVWYCSLETVS